MRRIYKLTAIIALTMSLGGGMAMAQVHRNNSSSNTEKTQTKPASQATQPNGYKPATSAKQNTMQQATGQKRPANVPATNVKQNTPVRNSSAANSNKTKYNNNISSSTSPRPNNSGVNNRYNGNKNNSSSSPRPSNSGIKPNYKPGQSVAPSRQPYRPTSYHSPRPTKPTYYKPYSNAPRIGSVLGIAFGTTIDYALSSLYNKNYYIDGYNDNTVYLRNVLELGYTWDDAMMQYENGYMCSAQFSNSTSYDNETRYNAMYSTLCRTYGDPVSYNYTSSQMSAAWYGEGGNSYVTLEYFGDYNGGSSYRYYTILSYSNE